MILFAFLIFVLPPQTTILTYYGFSNALDIKKIFEGRVGLDHNVASRKVDLKLNNIMLTDNKKFECKVQIPGDDEGKLSDTTRLLVLGKKCSVQC